MNEQASLAGITFTENGHVDVAQLNALYRCIGWDSHNRRTEAETNEMLRVSNYYIAAHNAEGTLVGFARVRGDPYVAEVLDVITHPAYRRRGIATQCMRKSGGAPTTVSLCVCEHDRWQWHCEGFYQQFRFGLQRYRTEMGARDRGHQQRCEQRVIICI